MIEKELANSTYFLKKSYTDSASRVCIATIILKINYCIETYSIEPSESKDEFNFLENSKYNSEYWLALTELIAEAIVFSNNLLKFELEIDKNSILVTKEDFEVFFNAIKDSKKPNAALKQAMLKYKNFINGKNT